MALLENTNTPIRGITDGDFETTHTLLCIRRMEGKFNVRNPAVASTFSKYPSLIVGNLVQAKQDAVAKDAECGIYNQIALPNPPK